MKKHYSPLATINSCDTTHLSEQGAAQVQGFIEYLKPRYQAIIDGQVKKEEVVRYYLEQEDSYTDGAKKLIGNISQALGISKGYISKIKSADKYLDGLQNDSYKDWVNEHPVTCRYYISKIDHQQSMDKFLSGKHFTQVELENAKTQGKADVERPVSEPVKTEYQQQMERQQQMVDDPDKGFIRTLGAAQIMLVGTRKDRLAAAIQTLYDLNYQDPNLEKAIEMVKYYADEALKKPEYKQASISKL